MDKFFYYLVTLLESALSVVGIRATYEQPLYAVVEQLDRGVETDAKGQRDGEAFGGLFRHITGANAGHAKIAMTAPPIPNPVGAIRAGVFMGETEGRTRKRYLTGKVAEWFKAPHSKSGVWGDSTVGSNPTLSASIVIHGL